MSFLGMAKTAALWLWQIPQNLVGAFIILVNIRSFRKGYFVVYTDKNGTEHKSFVHNKGTLDLHSDIINISLMIPMYTVKHLCDCGISLGRRIIIDSDSRISEDTVRHEYGHQKQSVYLGWLYLIVVGIPSVCGNIIDRVFHKEWTSKERVRWYYSRFPENWADRLGGVEIRLAVH